MDAKKLFADLVMIANIDGDIALQERILLDNYAKKLKIGFLEAQDIIELVKTGKLQTFYKPKSQPAKNALYRAIVKIVRVDSKVTSEERKLLRRLGNLLKIPAATVEQAVAGQKPEFSEQLSIEPDNTINVGGQTIDISESIPYKTAYDQTINIGGDESVSI